MGLRGLAWQCKYTPADGDLLRAFYIPLLRCAIRYDRTTGFYCAQTLAAAAAGVEALVANGGKMRLIAGCTLDEAEIAAIRKGEKLKDTVEARLLASPFVCESGAQRDSLELLAWMVANDFLQIKVAVPCQPGTRKPFANGEIFHEKAGIVEDARGDRLVFNGSINETLAAWQSRNWDTFHVFCSWKNDAGHLDADETTFQKLWADREPTAIVLGISEAVKNRLLQFLPAAGALPQKLAPEQPRAEAETGAGPAAQPQAEIVPDLFRQTWQFIREAPATAAGGEWVGAATAAVVPWPHQQKTFRRMYGHWPPRLLIADEVGLGKTIQAGLLIRQAWLAGRAKRILIMAPRALLGQWQLELREKFNLNFPIYDGGELRWYPSPALKDNWRRPVADADWHKEPFLLVSSQLMRRKERAAQLLEAAAPWDLLVLDEAHHARRQGSGREISKDAPNQLLRLMRKLKDRARGLLLLTATPMQINPVEVWDLLNLLGLPASWTAPAFLDFFRLTAHPNPDNAALAHVSALFRDVESAFWELELEKAMSMAADCDKFTVSKVLKALRNNAETPRKRLGAAERRVAMKLARQYNPGKMLISRHTRELLRSYRRAGQLASNIASRHVEDVMVELSASERRLYAEMEDYISTTYDNASPKIRNAVGFVMTIYRRRLASSFFALEQTLRARLAMLNDKKAAGKFNLEDLPDDELNDDALEEDAASRQRQALREEESGEIAALLEKIRALPIDTKAQKLLGRIAALQAEGYRQVMVFTQYTDSLDFLRAVLLRANPRAAVLCFSGRGGERWKNGEWEKITRDKTKEIFRTGQAEIMFCTDAAAEGLNFQFCGALINYDMPWNPMKVEQRIGRIDRLGQKYEHIRIVNFMYADTVEADIYQALRERISLFGAYVGKLQPILSRLPRVFEDIVLEGGERSRQLDRAVATMRQEIAAIAENGFDLDDLNDAAWTQAEDCAPPYDLSYLNGILHNAALLPPGHEALPLGEHDCKYSLPGAQETVRVTCDRDFYGEHAESVELWSPGSPAFPWENDD